MTKVKNINGTSQNQCSCGSWIQHWRNFGGASQRRYCCEKTCVNTNLVGAHVQKYNSTDRSWYIAPLCQLHNKSVGVLELESTVKLVSANKNLTCNV